MKSNLKITEKRKKEQVAVPRQVSEFEASLVCRANSRTAKATLRNSALKTNTQTKNQNKTKNKQKQKKDVRINLT